MYTAIDANLSTERDNCHFTKFYDIKQHQFEAGLLEELMGKYSDQTTSR